MTKEINIGGPAFPTPTHNLQNDGMTMRDYFAAKAMQGIITSDEYVFSKELFEITAKTSYVIADAMLKARE